MSESRDQFTAIRSHYEQRFGSTVKEIQWRKGPFGDLPSVFRILSFRKDDVTKVFGTCGMSLSPGRRPIELHFYVDALLDIDDRIAELLAITAHFHLTGSELGLGHTVDFGEPVIKGAVCQHGLISLPYLDGEGLEKMEGSDTRFYWLLPITQNELKLKKERGMDTLEQLFEEKAVNYLDLGRRSLC